MGRIGLGCGIVLLMACISRPVAAAPADDFIDRLRSLCGQAFAGEIVAGGKEGDGFTGKPLVMHVRECGDSQVKVPFHVGDDRSRTWVLTRTEAGLRLKHDHRHADGSEDAVTQYGGDTVEPGSGERQQFPADAFSRALFVKEKLPEAAQQNVWAMEIRPGGQFVYELSRPGRLFRVVFDLTQPLSPPPAPWGHE